MPGDVAVCHDYTTAQGCSSSTHVAWGNPGVTGAAQHKAAPAPAALLPPSQQTDPQ